MAQITSLLCQVITGKVNGAGTDGRVFLGLGGREFRLDSKADDYEAGSWREYVLGNPFPVSSSDPWITYILNKDWNDPRKGFPIDTINLDRSPVYIRFEPDGDGDNWNLVAAFALVYTGQRQFFTVYGPPQEFDNLWLGNRSGKILYLLDIWARDGQMLLKKGSKLARSASRSKK